MLLLLSAFIVAVGVCCCRYWSPLLLPCWSPLLLPLRSAAAAVVGPHCCCRCSPLLLPFALRQVRTAVVLNNCKPIWGETFSFPVTDLTHDFELECLDWNM